MKRSFNLKDKARVVGMPRRLLLLMSILAVVAMCFLGMAQLALAAPQQNAMVRVVHASPDAGNVDVFVDGTKLLTNFAFGTVTNYVPLAAGQHQIQVAPTGKGASAVITQRVSVDGGVVYTIAALGTSSTGYSLAAFVDKNSVSGNMASVRVYHLSPDAGPVNVATGGKTVISGLTYTNASSSLSVPGGSYTFNITATDTNATVPLSATLNGGMVYSVFAIGLLKDTPALTFKVASATGVPGMPNTGSNPDAVPVVQGPSLLPWLPGALLVLLIGGGLAARRSILAR